MSKHKESMSPASRKCAQQQLRSNQPLEADHPKLVTPELRAALEGQSEPDGPDFVAESGL